MKGIILASHGRLAEGLLDTLTIFSGEPQQIRALCLLPGEEITDFMKMLEEAIQEVDTGDGVVIFCDLLFGSPCNCSARLLQDPVYAEKISVITGMNLCMVLEYIGSREAGMKREALVNTGQQGIVDFNKMLAERKGS
ncbi:PTS sugar transporter subunit IIA [[Clostridium] innocuum]|nr:PTS sugar transporter subunit IIA [[Clostridium] innocuum]